VLALRRRAAGLIREGEFAAADDALSEAKRRDLDAVEELEANASLRHISATASRAERAAAAELHLDYRAADEHYAEAIALRPAEESEARWRYSFDRARALYDHGAKIGDNQALRDAVSRYRSALSLADRERVPLHWAATRNALGIALETLGERESGTARLEAVVIFPYRHAMMEYVPHRVPLDRAMTQNNSGGALRTLGELGSGTARLEDAVAAYRAALEVRKRDRVPLQWATTKNNLGTALQTLGERESSTARLEEAVAAYRAALEERREFPLDWAMTQNNLGTALQTLGERGSDTARLGEAVAAYRAALKGRGPPKKGSLSFAITQKQWAMTQNNLGSALRRLGERESGTARLEEAIAAFDACLTAMPGWQPEWVDQVCAAAKETLDEIERRAAKQPGGS
jgi:tetratricopeptide (TPR) repeat protein